MSDPTDTYDRFSFNGVVSKLRSKARRGPTVENDKLYRSHLEEEKAERSEFLTWAVPAFFFSLRNELQKHIDDLNGRLPISADRIQLHVNQRLMSDLVITSNVEASDWFQSGFSIEIATEPMTQEIIETYRRPHPLRFTENEVCLLEGADSTLRIATEKKSFSVPDYATHLIEQFLEERQALLDPPDDE